MLLVIVIFSIFYLAILKLCIQRMPPLSRAARKKTNKRLNRMMLIAILALPAAILLSIPSIVSRSYELGKNASSLLEPSALLNYSGACVGAFGTIIVGASTLYISKRFEEKNIRIQKQLVELSKQANILAQINAEPQYPYFDIQYIKTEKFNPSEKEKAEIPRHVTLPIRFERNPSRNNVKVGFRSLKNHTGQPKHGEYILTLDFSPKKGVLSEGTEMHFSLNSISDSIVTSIKLVALEYQVMGTKPSGRHKVFLPFDVEINGLVHNGDAISLQIEFIAPNNVFYTIIENATLSFDMSFETVTMKGQTFKQRYRIMLHAGKVISKEISPPTLCFANTNENT